VTADGKERHLGDQTDQKALAGVVVVVGLIATILTIVSAFVHSSLATALWTLAIALLIVGAALVWNRRASIKWSPGQIAGVSATILTSAAAWLAGPRRASVEIEWRAHLAGQSGCDPVTWHKLKEVIGFFVSAVRFRLADAADAAWTPADAILKSRMLSNLLVFGISAAATIDVGRHEGRLGVVVSAESLIGIGGAVYTLIRVGRWYRDVKPPEPKARRTKVDDDSS
jgi:hypothetical protein